MSICDCLRNPLGNEVEEAYDTRLKKDKFWKETRLSDVWMANDKGHARGRAAYAGKPSQGGRATSFQANSLFFDLNVNIGTGLNSQQTVLVKGTTKMTRDVCWFALYWLR